MLKISCELSRESFKLLNETEKCWVFFFSHCLVTVAVFCVGYNSQFTPYEKFVLVSQVLQSLQNILLMTVCVGNIFFSFYTQCSIAYFLVLFHICCIMRDHRGFSGILHYHFSYTCKNLDCYL